MNEVSSLLSPCQVGYNSLGLGRGEGPIMELMQNAAQRLGATGPCCSPLPPAAGSHTSLGLEGSVLSSRLFLPDELCKQLPSF